MNKNFPKTMTQAGFSRLIGYSQSGVSRLKNAGKLVMSGRRIDVVESIRKLAADRLKETSVKDELDRLRAVRLREQCEKYDDELAKRIRAEVARELSQKLRRLRALLTELAAESEEARLAICEAIDKTIEE